nr:uncharacterized protein LOC112722095 [Arachis hypogaea]
MEIEGQKLSIFFVYFLCGPGRNWTKYGEQLNWTKKISYKVKPSVISSPFSTLGIGTSSLSLTSLPSLTSASLFTPSGFRPSALLQVSKAVKDHILCSASPVSRRHRSSGRSPSLTKTPTLLVHLGRLAAVAHVGVAPTSRVTILTDLPLRSTVSGLCSPCRPSFLRRRLSGDRCFQITSWLVMLEKTHWITVLLLMIMKLKFKVMLIQLQKLHKQLIMSQLQDQTLLFF